MRNGGPDGDPIPQGVIATPQGDIASTSILSRRRGRRPGRFSSTATSLTMVAAVAAGCAAPALAGEQSTNSRVGTSASTSDTRTPRPEVTQKKFTDFLGALDTAAPTLEESPIIITKALPGQTLLDMTKTMVRQASPEPEKLNPTDPTIEPEWTDGHEHYWPTYYSSLMMFGEILNYLNPDGVVANQPYKLLSPDAAKALLYEERLFHYHRNGEYTEITTKNPRLAALVDKFVDPPASFESDPPVDIFNGTVIVHYVDHVGPIPTYPPGSKTDSETNRIHREAAKQIVAELETMATG